MAPSGLKSGASRPLPKSSAAWARRRIGLTWLRMNRVATPNSTIELPTIHMMKMYVVEENSRFSGTSTRISPLGSWTSMITLSSSKSGLVSITKG